jgi:hypothetical protein
LELLPGWDAIEDMIGAALVSRQPIDEASRFRASVNVVEVSNPLPEDLHAFAEKQAAQLVEQGAEVVELYRLPAGSRSREVGVLAVGIVVRYPSTDRGYTVISEQTWADGDSGSLVFTIMADEEWYRVHREEMLSVPRSLELASWFES